MWTPEGYTFNFDDQEIWSKTKDEAPVSMRTEYIILSTHIFEEFAGPIPASSSS